MTVECPTCKKEVPEGTADFPFCSERCRILDLGNWASGKYVISTPIESPQKPEDDEDAE